MNISPVLFSGMLPVVTVCQTSIFGNKRRPSGRTRGRCLLLTSADATSTVQRLRKQYYECQAEVYR